MRLAAPAALLLALSPAFAAPPATLRVDIQHGGDAKAEHFALERVLVEALPWPGNPARPIDDTNRGVNQVRVLDAETGAFIGKGRAAKRIVMSWVSAVALFVGYLWMIWDPQKQTWHDKVARSVVVRR